MPNESEKPALLEQLPEYSKGPITVRISSRFRLLDGLRFSLVSLPQDFQSLV